MNALRKWFKVRDFDLRRFDTETIIIWMPQFLEQWKQKARALKIEVYALYLAYKDPRTPWYARVFAACVVGYALARLT